MISLIALIIFGLFLLAYLFFGGAIIYHLRRYKIKGDLTKLMSIIFIVVSLVLISLSFISFFTIDWNDLGGLF